MESFFSSQRRSSLMGGAVLLIEVCCGSRRQLRQLHALHRWAAQSRLLQRSLEASAEIGQRAEEKGRAAVLRERQARAEEAAARGFLAGESETKKELTALKRRFATEADRRAVLTNELRECQQQRDTAARKEVTARTMLRRAQEVREAEQAKAKAEVEAAEARAAAAEGASQEAAAQNALLQQASHVTSCNVM